MGRESGRRIGADPFGPALRCRGRDKRHALVGLLDKVDIAVAESRGVLAAADIAVVAQMASDTRLRLVYPDSTVVAVPLSDVRMRQRGYNQAGLLAAVVGRMRGWEARPDLLERSRATETQTALHPAERRANVAGAFQALPDRAPPVRRQHILVVDDVWTTGATTLACAEALLAGGARAVSVLTFARALPELRR